jgi:DNA repair protein RadD
MSEVEELLKRQKRLTPLIIKNIIDITESYGRQGVMIFSSTVRHAQEILSYLPEGEAEIILGDTDNKDRDQITQNFKDKKIKYLVNVSVLTTGFDAPHVDVIAILRPTESVGLYQQIIGRGLRLSEGKEDCFILDYTGMGHDIYSPEVGDKRPSKESEAVKVVCPECHFENDFWGILGRDGEILEHYGRRCKGATQDYVSGVIVPCGFRFRFKICHACGEENDITARECLRCRAVLIDAEAKLKEAKLSKDLHVLTPDSVDLEEKKDKNGNSYLDVRYYDYDSKCLAEIHYLDNETSLKKFNINFLRSHLKRPELSRKIKTIDDVLDHSHFLRKPKFIIARRQGKFWKITEKIFSEELRNA